MTVHQIMEQSFVGSGSGHPHQKLSLYCVHLRSADAGQCYQIQHYEQSTI